MNATVRTRSDRHTRQVIAGFVGLGILVALWVAVSHLQNKPVPEGFVYITHTEGEGKQPRITVYDGENVRPHEVSCPTGEQAIFYYVGDYLVLGC